MDEARLLLRRRRYIVLRFGGGFAEMEDLIAQFDDELQQGRLVFELEAKNNGMWKTGWQMLHKV